MKKKRKTYSVDAMMRFFLQYYNIPTKQDVDKILKRLDRLEAAIVSKRATGRGVQRGRTAKEAVGKQTAARPTATEQVVAIIKQSPHGIDVAGLKEQSGFEDKKIRNIVFRLVKQGRIKRIGRGAYAAE